MNTQDLINIEKSSRRAAIISLIGLLILISSLLYTSLKLVNKTDQLDRAERQLEKVKNSLTSEQQKVKALKNIESKENEYLVNLLKATQSNHADRSKTSSIINWDTLKSTIIRLPAGRRKLAVTLALLTTWQEVPFKFGINNPRVGYDATGFIKFILGQVGITVKQGIDEKLSDVMMKSFTKVSQPSPGDLMFYRENRKGKKGNFGLIYLCEGNVHGRGIAVGTLDIRDPLNIYDTSESLDPNAFLGYYRVAY